MIFINIDDNRLCTNQRYRNRDFLSYFEAYFLAQHVIINDPHYHIIWIYFISIDELIIKIKRIKKFWWIYHIFYFEHIVKVEALYLILPIVSVWILKLYEFCVSISNWAQKKVFFYKLCGKLSIHCSGNKIIGEYAIFLENKYICVPAKYYDPKI